VKHNYRQRKTVAMHALHAQEERGENEHGKALRLPQEQAHQNQGMFGSQEQESGSVSGQQLSQFIKPL